MQWSDDVEGFAFDGACCREAAADAGVAAVQSLFAERDVSVCFGVAADEHFGVLNVSMHFEAAVQVDVAVGHTVEHAEVSGADRFG